MYYSVAMTLRTLILLAATAMAVLLAGCGSSQKEDQGSSHGGSQREVGSSQQTSKPTTNETSVGRCADSGGTIGQQEEASRGEVSNGKIAFTRRTAANSDIYVTDQTGAHETQLTYTKQFEAGPVWSPDGQKIAFLRSTSIPSYDLYVMNADGTHQTRLTGVWEMDSAWSPDGQKIAFTRGADAPNDLYVINADGTNEVSLITGSFSENPEDRTELGDPVWSPDGNKIAFASRTLTYTGASSSAEPASAPAEGLTGIYLINVDGTGLCKLTSGVDPVWSPDGEKIAFYDYEAIYVINADGSGRKQLTSGINDPSHDPSQLAWSPDGQWIAFIDHSSELYVTNDDGSSGLLRLIDPPGSSSVALPTWSPDSEKIAFACPVEALVGSHTDLCVINTPDRTGLKRIASNVAPEGFQVAVSWGRG
jgi:Tol biopolymer transport system component